MCTHNLVDTLSAQPKVVSNLRKRLPPHASLTNLSVPCILSARSGTQRSPFPAGKHLQGTASIRRKFTFPMPLPCVVHPVAKPNVLVAEVFDMSCRDCAVTLANAKLVQCTDVKKELFRMVHASTIVGEGCETQPSTLRWWKGLEIYG